MLLEQSRSQLLVIDIQDRLAPHIANINEVVDNSAVLLAAAQRLDIPVTVTEQYVRGLGPTVEPLQPFIEGVKVFEKLHFSAVADPAIRRHLQQIDQSGGRNQIVICGIEAHVCVLQTALALARAGQNVAVVIDAVGSRRTESLDAARARLLQNGIEVVTTEMVLFEWLHVAGTDIFKDLSKLIQ
ncbi:hydrolase [Govanella unica]|uniref:Hydrolase n=1 Tax=Govanella unica TaxID=2975056 RepID=A0A9X3TVR2_9PROT|nr:hydrolase [Govania unica]MDA5192582.1 hydrolase [Govania unica]